MARFATRSKCELVGAPSRLFHSLGCGPSREYGSLVFADFFAAAFASLDSFFSIAFAMVTTRSSCVFGLLGLPAARRVFSSADGDVDASPPAWRFSCERTIFISFASALARCTLAVAAAKRGRMTRRFAKRRATVCVLQANGRFASLQNW
jgi:hypothetical protein